MRYYEDFDVGVTWFCPDTYEVTEDEILEMGRRWDPQPFHTDPVAAAASPFGGLVASTVHLFGIGNKLGMEADPVAAISNLGMSNVVNHAPARPGDVMTFELTPLEKRLSNSRPGVGIVSFRGMLRNQRGEEVFSTENAALIACRPG
jgi:acyl dehydratase